MLTRGRDIPFFQGQPLPPETRLVGLSALVHTLGLHVPLRRLACVSSRHVRGGCRGTGLWRVFDRRYEPGEGACHHLAFALRHEDLDLLALKAVLAALPFQAVRDFIAATPTGVGTRRLWYWYEHLLGTRLDLSDAPKVQAVPLLDPKRYFVLPGHLSVRHRVRDNALGTAAFCPVIRRTAALEAFEALNLSERARLALAKAGKPLALRAASFMLLADTQASFAIEQERPPRNRLELWGQAVLEAGLHPLNLQGLERLHQRLIGDDRFVHPGLRSDGVFLGTRSRDGEPRPEFIGARPDDLPDLMDALFACHERLKQGGLDPVLHATAIAFGFIYIHPLEDGNGRVHRGLIHQVLTERGFTPPGVILPISAVMAERLDDYRATLRAHSGPLLPLIPWRSTGLGNVEVTGATADLYRYFDCTVNAEFLYACVAQTVAVNLPSELAYLQAHDRAKRGVMARVGLSDRQAENFITYVRQNEGKLSKARRQREFARLTEDEVTDMEMLVAEAYERDTQE